MPKKADEEIAAGRQHQRDPVARQDVTFDQARRDGARGGGEFAIAECGDDLRFVFQHGGMHAIGMLGGMPIQHLDQRRCLGRGRDGGRSRHRARRGGNRSAGRIGPVHGAQQVADGLGFGDEPDRQPHAERPFEAHHQFGPAEAVDAEVAFQAAGERRIAAAAVLRMKLARQRLDDRYQLALARAPITPPMVAQDRQRPSCGMVISESTFELDRNQPETCTGFRRPTCRIDPPQGIHAATGEMHMGKGAICAKVMWFFLAERTIKSIVMARGDDDMSYATLMVHVDVDGELPRRARIATELAERFGAHLIGIAAWGPMSLFLAEDARRDPRPRETHLQDMKSLLDRKGNDFRTQLGLGGRRFEWRSVLDLPTDAVAREARAADLVVIGNRRENADPFRALDPGGVLMQAGRPVLVVPDAVQALPARHIAVAWKNAREARRAVRDALPFLRRAENVMIVEIVEGADDAPSGKDVAALSQPAWCKGRDRAGANRRGHGHEYVVSADRE